MQRRDGYKVEGCGGEGRERLGENARAETFISIDPPQNLKI